MKPKVLLFALLSILLSIIWVSCSKEYSSPLKGLSVEDMKFYSPKSSNRITIGDVDLTGFSAYCSDFWCNATISGHYLEVTVMSNTKELQRQTTVTITDPEDGTTLSFRVFQAPLGEIILNDNTYRVPERGGEITINVKSNVKYNIEIPSDVDWIKLVSSSTRGLEPSIVVLNVLKNETGKERSTTISLSNSETNAIEKVTIIQEITPYVDADKDEISIGPDGGEFELTVRSNVNFKVECRYNWTTVIGDTKIDDNKYDYRIKVSPLSENERRINYIYFRNPVNNELLWVVTVDQEAFLRIITRNINLYVGETYPLIYTNNSGQSITWKSSNTGVATVDNKGNVIGNSEGTATIKTATEDGKYYDEIEVTIIKKQEPQVEPIDEPIDKPSVSSLINVKTGAGFASIVGPNGAFVGYYVSSTIRNDSDYDIIINKCTVYQGNTHVGTENINQTLKTGGSKSVEVTSSYNITTNSYTFVWEYVYDGKTYTCTANYN